MAEAPLPVVLAHGAGGDLVAEAAREIVEAEHRARIDESVAAFRVPVPGVARDGIGGILRGFREPRGIVGVEREAGGPEARERRGGGGPRGPSPQPAGPPPLWGPRRGR